MFQSQSSDVVKDVIMKDSEYKLFEYKFVIYMIKCDEKKKCF